MGEVLRSSGSEDRRTPSHLRPSGPEERRTPPHLPPSRPEERRTPPTFFFFRPPPSTNPHQVFSALLRSESSARFFTLKIGPKIEIGPLFDHTNNKPVFERTITAGKPPALHHRIIWYDLYKIPGHALHEIHEKS